MHGEYFDMRNLTLEDPLLDLRIFNNCGSGSKYGRFAHLCRCWCCYRRTKRDVMHETSSPSLIGWHDACAVKRENHRQRMFVSSCSVSPSQTLSMSSNDIWFMSTF